MGRDDLPATPAEALADVLTILKLRPAGVTQGGERRYNGQSTRRRLPFVFGGQLVAQALSAAYETAPPGLRVHVLPAHFLEPGDPRVQLHYDVEAVRERGTVHVRRVRVRQARPANPDDARQRIDSTEVLVLDVSLSFTADRPGLGLPGHGSR